MKKTLFALILMAGFSYVTQAQSSDKATESAVEPVKVEVAGQTASDATATEQATTISSESSVPAKSCCSSKKGKETAHAKSKSCCANGKKSKADCDAKKDDSVITQ